MVESAFDRITQNPTILAGQAAIRDLRISVAHVVNLIANGMAPAQIVAELLTSRKRTFARRSPMLLPWLATIPGRQLRMSPCRNPTSCLNSSHRTAFEFGFRETGGN